MKSEDYDVVVVGGGPAGSAAAIHLAGAGYRVLLLEKAAFPREKLCGEFLSTEVREMCRRLGVLDAMMSAGARSIHTLELSDRTGVAFIDSLPGTALSLSRTSFDHLLFERAAAAGAEAYDDEGVTAIQGDLKRGFSVETVRRSARARTVIGAYGRRSVLDRRLERPFLSQQSPFVGFKARHDGARREGIIELHAFPGGYCGLIEDENGSTNVCWLARSRNLKDAGGSPDAMVGQVLRRNPRLAERLDDLHRTGDFLAVSQLSFEPKALFAGGVCMVGDAAGMIAPLCGDGMGMAIRTAEVAAPLVARFIDGRMTAEAFRRAYGAAWHREFAFRMRLGRWLNAALTKPLAGRLVVRAARAIPAAARASVSATRG